MEQNSTRAIPSPLPSYLRADGFVGFTVRGAEGRSRIADCMESGASRVRFPNHAGKALEAMLVNVAGGIAGGDRFRVEWHVEDGAEAVMTTSAAERIYRALGAPAKISTSIRCGKNAKAIWLPNDLILYDGAEALRRIDADCAGSSTLLIAETIVLGRTASGETFRTGRLQDRWRIRRDGRLVFAEDLRLDALALDGSANPARQGGHPVLATAFLSAPDIEERLEQARNLLGEDGESECAASAWNGFLVVRGRAKQAEPLRKRLALLWRGLNLFPVPREWG
jgi:urease accessory protein